MAGHPGDRLLDSTARPPRTQQRPPALVEVFIATMRELQGVSSPEELAYRSWREPERMEEGRVYTPDQVEELDPGEIPLLLDLGGIPALPV